MRVRFIVVADVDLADHTLPEVQELMVDALEMECEDTLSHIIITAAPEE